MRDAHYLGAFETLTEVWDLYPHGGCPGDYVVVGGEKIVWNDDRRVWGEVGDDVSSMETQHVEGNLIVDGDLTVGGATKGKEASFTKLKVESLDVENPPYADKNHNHDEAYAKRRHKHDVSDIKGFDGEDVVLPGTIENAKHADKAHDLDEDSPVYEKVLRSDQPDSTPHPLGLLGGAVVEGGLKADSADIEKFTEPTTFEKGATTLNLLVQELATIYDLDVSHVATMFRTIIKDYVSSETFIPGLMGEGMKLYKALNGDWNLEVDNAVIRKTMTIFELVISKIRAVNGGLVISPANGRIKSVEETTGEPTYYVLGIEGDMEFVADDLVRCQVFTTGQVKYYWVPVASVTADSILVLKSEFADGVAPVPGDDLIQMGNRTNTARQGLLYLTASEDGKPRFSVLDGVDSTSFAGKSKVILGCLDGMTDTDFPADFQPSGYGLYAMNVFLKGVFLLRNGKSVESEIETAKGDALTAKERAFLVEQLFQEFTMAGGVFESKITEVKTYTDTKVDGLQIGGRNLLRNSSNWRSAGWNGGFGDNGGGYVIDSSVLYNGLPTLKTDVGTGLMHSWLKLQNGVWYTYSAMVRCNRKIDGDASIPLHCWAGKDNLNQGKIKFLSYDTSVIADEWKLIHLTFRLTYDADSFRPIFYRGANESTFYWIAYFKLEKGNKPTDWTPAPEDVQTQIDTHSTAIEQNAQSITLKASQSEFDSLTGRVSSAEGSISVQAGQIAAQVTSVDALTGRVNSAELALQPGNIWLGIKDSVLSNIPSCSTQVDTRSLDPNKYYLVTIGMNITVPYTITVERPLYSSYGVPPYCTHGSGFSVICKWQSNGSGWGASGVKRIIQTLEYSFVGSCPVGSIGQITESSEEYIYVRGGSLYNIRVDGASSAVVTLRTSIHTPRPDYPSSSRPGVIDSVVQPVPDLDLKPSKDELLSTGIDISNRKIVLTSDKVVFQNNSGNQIALFENDRIKADLIDAKKIVTGSLIAEVFAATNITTGNLTVTSGAKIGGWSVSGNDLTCNGEGSARLRVEVDGYDFLRINDYNDAFLTIRRDTGKCVRLYTYDPDSIALDINAGKGTALSVYGKIKVNGNYGVTADFDTYEVWNGGRQHITLRYVNGILVNWWYR